VLVALEPRTTARATPRSLLLAPLLPVGTVVPRNGPTAGRQRVESNKESVRALTSLEARLRTEKPRGRTRQRLKPNSSARHREHPLQSPGSARQPRRFPVSARFMRDQRVPRTAAELSRTHLLHDSRRAAQLLGTQLAKQRHDRSCNLLEPTDSPPPPPPVPSSDERNEPIPIPSGIAELLSQTGKGIASTTQPQEFAIETLTAEQRIAARIGFSFIPALES
jgi:hypothetical protein